MKDIVRKYAHAYVNIFGDTLTHEDIIHGEQAADFLRTHRRVLFLLKVPLIPIEVKQRGLVQFIERFSLPSSLQMLTKLLLRNKHAYLLADILDYIKDIYTKEHEIHAFNVVSSSELQDDQKEEIKGFLADRVRGTIIYKYAVDKKLIAGIRLQSDTLLWERSIDKQLRDILLSCKQ